MKVGVLQFFSWSRRIPLETVYGRALERIEVMDQTGYDCVWLAEHHFNTYSVCPSVNVMGAHVAARTRNVRIGMAVSLAAFYNPLRLAEDVAMIDVLSGGRVNWGAGRGFDRTEFAAFGVPAGGELGSLPRMRGDRPDRVAQRAAELRGALLELRGRRAAAQARAEASSTGVARRDLAGLDPARGREGIRHPPGSARDPGRARTETPAVLREPARARLPDGGP